MVPVTDPRVLVVAPVLNLSGSQDFDPLKVTDWIASECVSFPGVSVIPVNRTLAELAARGKATVETPEDAVELARTFGADATLVAAVTEYNPYDPPRVGLIVQWYAPAPPTRTGAFDPTAASRLASDPPVELSAAEPHAPRWQAQRVFDAADETLLDELKDYADDRGGHESPFGWRRYTKSQELYVRYCGWALIRTMLKLDAESRVPNEPHEASR